MSRNEVHGVLGGPGEIQRFVGDPENYCYEIYRGSGLDLLFEETRGLVQLIVNLNGAVTIGGQNLIGMSRSQLIAKVQAQGVRPKFDRHGFFTTGAWALGGRVYKGEVISVSIAEPNLAETFVAGVK